MKYTTLISAAKLHAGLGRPDWAVVDCRFDLLEPASGAQLFAAGHIPGAVYAHLDGDLSAPLTATSGRHPLPHPATLALQLGKWGIANDMQVVAYDAANSMFAARLWWLLRWLGHERVAVLDGGLKAWEAAGYPLQHAISHRPPTVFRPQVDSGLKAAPIVDAEQVAARVQMPHWRVLDARAGERFSGSVEPIDSVAGHIPGARSHPLSSSLQADGRFLPPAELRTRLQGALDGTRMPNVIAMCGSGVTACHTLLALEIAGLLGAHLYPGSWSEWIRDPSRPVKQGIES